MGVAKKNDSIVAVLDTHIESEKERIATMLYISHSHCCFDFGPERAFRRPAQYCGMRPRTRLSDDKRRGNHDKSTSTFGISIGRSP